MSATATLAVAPATLRSLSIAELLRHVDRTHPQVAELCRRIETEDLPEDTASAMAVDLENVASELRQLDNELCDCCEKGVYPDIEDAADRIDDVCRGLHRVSWESTP